MAQVVVTSYEHVRYVNNEHSVLRRAEARYERFFERGRTVSAEAYSSGSTLRSFLATPLLQCRSEPATSAGISDTVHRCAHLTPCKELER